MTALRRWLAAAALGLLLLPPAVAHQDGSESRPTTSSATGGYDESNVATPQLPPAAEEESEPEPGGAPEPEIEEVADRRVSFSFAVPEERGGGNVTGRAGQLRTVSSTYVVLIDRVEVEYGQLKVQADRLELDLDANTLVGRGNVILDQGPRRVAGDTIAFDLTAETGTLENATAYLDPDFYFRGERISKVGPDTYAVEDGVFTSCSEEVPDWSFRMARARVTVEGYARAHHTRARVKRLPFFYFPYILWPAKSERTSGFLVPNVGYSEQRGTELGLAYYLVLGRSYDTTVYLDTYGRETDFLGFGNEFRYQPGEQTSGIFRGQALRDAESGETEWKVAWVHDTRSLPFGMRGVVRVQEYSDFDFFQGFERQFNRLTQRSLYSSANVSGSWGGQSLNILVDNRTSFLSGGELQQRQLPEIEYRLRDTQLGETPLYLSLQASAHYIDIAPASGEGLTYGRTDWIPNLEFPVSTLPWLSLSLNAGARVTHYTDSVDPDTGQVTGETLTRTVPLGSAEFIGPSFSRIFDRPLGPFAKFKHLIEPQIRYNYAEEFEDEDSVLRFDEVDRVSSRDIATVALVNRVLAKPKPEAPTDEEEEAEAGEVTGVEETEEGEKEGEAAPEVSEAPAEEGAEEPEEAGGDVLDTTAPPNVDEQLAQERFLTQEFGAGSDLEGSPVEGAGEQLDLDALEVATEAAREILSFEVAQSISFREDRPLQQLVTPGDPEAGIPDDVRTSDRGPIVARLRFNPSEGTSLQAQVDYGTLNSGLLSTSFSGGFRLGQGVGIGASWFTSYDPLTGEATSDQARLFTSFQVVPRHLRLESQVNYDIQRSLLQQQFHAATWVSQCWTLRLEYRDFESASREITDVRLLLSLKNVGTFLDLNSGSDTLF